MKIATALFLLTAAASLGSARHRPDPTYSCSRRVVLSDCVPVAGSCGCTWTKISEWACVAGP